MTTEQASEEIKTAVEKMVTKIKQQTCSRGVRAANALRNAELEILKGQRSGRVYRKPHTKKSTYTASAPGEAPARRTGALRLNWITGVDTKSNSGKGAVSIVAYLESNTPYSGILEYGSSKMAPRPYVEKIKEQAKPEIERIMSESYE